MDQVPLFDLPPSSSAHGPTGLDYRDGWLSVDDEAALIETIRRLPLAPAVYKGYTARRRVVSYGGSFDYDTNRLLPAAPLAETLLPLRARAAAWAGLDPEALVHALVAEYVPGTPLGWHRDVPDFEQIIGISLGTPAEIRFRPYPPHRRPATPLRLVVAPRFIYRLQGAARWEWQHRVMPVDALRWSITFRTRRSTA